jgi:thiol:disulfide interchange protein DsbD
MLDQALLKAFALFGPPGIIFYDSNGNEIPAARLVGFMSAANFKKHLTRYVVAKSI